MADRVILWDSDTEMEVSDQFNISNVYRNTMGEVTFSVKNESDDFAAKGVSVAALDGSTGELTRDILLSSDGLVYSATLQVGDIPPGGLSEELILRRIIPSNAEMRFDFIVRVDAVTWVVPEQDIDTETIEELEDLEIEE